MDFSAISLAYQLNCPSCGALVKFASKSSVYAVCEFCKSMLVRHDLNLEDLGKVAQLQNDPSPFQIGSSGIYQKKQFTLIGRVQMKWEDGFWNEWRMFFNDEKVGWLAEAQGFIMVSFETPSKDIPAFDKIFPEQEISIQNKTFKVDDIKTAQYAFFEGELPFKATKGEEIQTVDLSGTNEEFASISFINGTSQVYIGNYVTLEDLKCKNLRKFDGWERS